MNIYRQAVQKFGHRNQIKKTIEECTELSLALQHYQDGKVTAQEVATEIADVEIMVSQMREIFGSIVDAEKLKKLNRLKALV